MRLFVLFLLLTSAVSHAQSTRAELEARLLRKPLYLRGLWRYDKLSFDADGKLLGSSAVGSFTVSGVDITKVVLKTDHLELEGRRAGLRFKNDQARRVPIRLPDGQRTIEEVIRFKIQTPPDGDFAPALAAIFTESLPDLVPLMPDGWQTYAREHFLPHSAPAVNASAILDPAKPVPNLPAAISEVKRVGGAVAPPVVLKIPEPDFSQEARGTRLTGKVLIYLQVDQEGKTRNLRILHPCGLGLDENALLAVKAYEFKPAMQDGHPVAVEMNVEVKFQIY